ncbi:MAG: threonine ammonia-lyase, biosynthetic [Candidatus Oxydemutatoraceae bacterium WSBS_2016_MAG_OTU14]
MITPSEYIKKIDQAKIYDVARVTPLNLAHLLSEKLNNWIFLKREDLQPVFSFKLRGAYNKIASLSESERKKGVIAASAGNHAQGVALASLRFGICAMIVMPTTTPPIKIAAVKKHGAEVVLHGDTYDEASQYVQRLAKEKGMTLIPPYDDIEIIAGQGTVGKEIYEQSRGDQPYAVFVPVGGGGLIAGISIYLKTKWPDIKIIGVEAEDSPTLHAALQAGKRVVLDQVGLFADGTAVRQIGEETFAIARDYVDEVVLVTTDQICAAVKDHFDETRGVPEPAGALATAGIKKYVEERPGLTGKKLVSIVSGANINFDRLKHIVERYEIGASTEALFAVTLPESPGSFLAFCRLLGAHTITEFNYRYASSASAHVFVGIKFENALEEGPQMIEQLRENHYEVLNLSNNEMAKLHLRFMIGGQPQALKNERLFRFQFPEKPGALHKFLERIQKDWNISLFHYRNHGAAYGRVLVGIQVPENEWANLDSFVKSLGYRYFDENNNPAYPLFLK